MRLWVRSLALLSGLRIQCCCVVGFRCGSGPALLWLGRRPAATPLIRPLAWEPPYAEGVALERKGKKTKKKKKKKKERKRAEENEDKETLEDLSQRDSERKWWVW